VVWIVVLVWMLHGKPQAWTQPWIRRVILGSMQPLPTVSSGTSDHASNAKPSTPNARLFSIICTQSICAFLTTLSTVEGLTHTGKWLVQRRRPNFYALCGFDKITRQCMFEQDYVIEAHLSFPSGHSSLSMCSMIFIGMFTASQLLSLEKNLQSTWRVRICILLLVAGPWLLAIYCGLTRLFDSWHHPSDVLAGWLLGGLVGLVGFHMWFPPLGWGLLWTSQGE
jgi:membrane-associated phospholipid phosphatase